jgi:hypothetical protein
VASGIAVTIAVSAMACQYALLRLALPKVASWWDASQGQLLILTDWARSSLAQHQRAFAQCQAFSTVLHDSGVKRRMCNQAMPGRSFENLAG